MDVAYGRVLVEVGIDLQYVKQVIYPKPHIIAADKDASAIYYLEFQNKRQAQEISDLFFTLIIRKRFSWF